MDSGIFENSLEMTKLCADIPWMRLLRVLF